MNKEEADKLILEGKKSQAVRRKLAQIRLASPASRQYRSFKAPL